MIKKDLSDEDAARVMAWIDEQMPRLAEGEKPAREACGALLIHVLMVTALRGDELARVAVRDLDLNKGLLHLYSAAKGSERRSVALSPRLCVNLNIAIMRMGLVGTDLLVNIFTRARSKASRLLILRRFWARKRMYCISNFENAPSLHGFRHTGARVVFEDSGRDIRAVQRFLGHKAITSTERYLVAFDDEELHELIRKGRLGR